MILCGNYKVSNENIREIQVQVSNYCTKDVKAEYKINFDNTRMYEPIQKLNIKDITGATSAVY